MLSIIIVVALCAIMVVFSKEWGQLIKKFFAIPGVLLFLPLIALTFLVLSYEPWVLSGLQAIKSFLFMLIANVGDFIAVGFGRKLAAVLIILAVPLLPVYAIQIWIKNKPYRSFHYLGFLEACLWLFVAMLYVIGVR